MTVPELSVDQALERLEAGSADFVDVRDRGSWRRGHLPSALHLGDHNVADFVREADKSRCLIVYCYHGNSSIGGAAHFLEQGFEEVYSMAGGFAAWHGRPVESEPEPAFPAPQVRAAASESDPDVPWTALNTDRDFDMLLQEGLGIVDFWAEWCGPCQIMGPWFEAVARKYAGGPVRFCKVNSDAASALSRRFKVRTLPTLLVVHDGRVVHRGVGLHRQEDIEALVERLLREARPSRRKALFRRARSVLGR